MLVAFTALAVAISCKEPTQVIVEARTNAPHRPGLATSFTVGGPGQVEKAEPTTETREPWGVDGFIGSLVVVPGTRDDAQLAVKIVMGVRRDARDCRPPDYDGCIVARRRLRYSPGERLRLPVALYARCEGVPCDELSTCNALGLCVDVNVDPSTCGSADGCRIPGDDVPPPSGVDLDASSDGDAASVFDASADASPDVRSDGGTGDGGIIGGGTPDVVDCRTTTCTKPLECCYNHQTATGTCVGTGTCIGGPTWSVTCDGHEDCAAGQACCWGSGATFCTTGVCPYGEVCHSTNDCTRGGACTNDNVYYRSCQ